MIEFRDRYARQVGARLIVHTNPEAIADGTQPFAVGTQRCCGLLKTKSLLDALEAGGFDAAFGGARRDEERSRAKERIFSLRDRQGPVGSEAAAARALAPAQRPHPAGREHPRLPALELDRDRRLAVHPRRADSGRAALLRAGARGHRPRRLAHRCASSRSCRCCPASAAAAGDVPHALARLLAVHRRGAVDGRHGARRSSRS